MGPRRWLSLLLLAGGCRNLDDQACERLRAEAFELLNGSHACRDDADCLLTDWPGCPKPVNREAGARIAHMRARFAGGGCKEQTTSCPTAPEAYCDRQLCIFHHRRQR